MWYSDLTDEVTAGGGKPHLTSICVTAIPSPFQPSILSPSNHLIMNEHLLCALFKALKTTLIKSQLPTKSFFCSKKLCASSTWLSRLRDQIPSCGSLNYSKFGCSESPFCTPPPAVLCVLSLSPSLPLASSHNKPTSMKMWITDNALFCYSPWGYLHPLRVEYAFTKELKSNIRFSGHMEGTVSD